jgi:hypothetical protein
MPKQMALDLLMMRAPVPYIIVARSHRVPAARPASLMAMETHFRSSAADTARGLRPSPALFHETAEISERARQVRNSTIRNKSPGLED